MDNKILDEVEGLYRIVPLTPFRRTKGVMFDMVPMDILPRIDGIDRVIHSGGAVSPGSVGEISRPWYMHHYQADHLIVIQGTRYTEIYTQDHGRIESFDVAPDHIKKNGEVVFDGPAMLVWPTGVFHRIKSDDKAGSVSLNFAVRYEGFDMRTNFNVYNVDISTGKYNVIREGHLDQDVK